MAIRPLLHWNHSLTVHYNIHFMSLIAIAVLRDLRDAVPFQKIFFDECNQEAGLARFPCSGEDGDVFRSCPMNKRISFCSWERF